MMDTVRRRACVALCLAGAGIAGYLTYVHYAGAHPIWGISHGCETGQTSRYASLIGILVALLGPISYVLILIALRKRDERALLTGQRICTSEIGSRVLRRLGVLEGALVPVGGPLLAVERGEVLGVGHATVTGGRVGPSAIGLVDRAALVAPVQVAVHRCVEEFEAAGGPAMGSLQVHGGHFQVV